MLTQRIIQLRFAGGPHDGLRVFATDLPDTRLLFPGGPLAADAQVVSYSRLPEGVATVYRFERTEPAAGGPAGGGPAGGGAAADESAVGGLDDVPVMHFRFEGFRETQPPQSKPGRQMRWPWQAAAAKMKPWAGRLRKILLAPVPHPLQVPEQHDSGLPARLPPK